MGILLKYKIFVSKFNRISSDSNILHFLPKFLDFGYKQQFDQTLKIGLTYCIYILNTFFFYFVSHTDYKYNKILCNSFNTEDQYFHVEKQKSPKNWDRYAVDREITDSLKKIPILIPIPIPIIVPTLVSTTHLLGTNRNRYML